MFVYICKSLINIVNITNVSAFKYVTMLSKV